MACDRGIDRSPWPGERRRLCAAVLAAWVSPLALAQPAGAAPLRTELLKTGLFLISGGGANSLLRLSARGLILVDAKFEASHRALRAEVRRTNRIADLPLRVLLLTSGDDSHSGGAARFLADGVPVVLPAGARVVLPAMQPASAASAASAPSATSPTGRGGPAPAVVAVDREYEIRLGGAAVRLLAFGPARGAGDGAVWFPDLKVVAVGGLYTAGIVPPVATEGGSITAWSAALDQVLALDFDLAVPASGPPVRRAEIEAFRSRLSALADPSAR